MAQPQYYNTGGGVLYFTPFENGKLGTEVPFGGTENVGFTTEIEKLTHDNTETATVFEDISILKKVTGTINIETIEMSPDMLTRAFLGKNNSIIRVANAIAEDAELGKVTITEVGTAYPIAVKYLDVDTIVVKDSSETITFDIDDDYTLDTVDGVTTITAVPLGGIDALDVVHVSADNKAYSDIEIEAFIESKLEGQLRFVSDVANGLAYEYTFHKVSLMATGDYNLKSTDEFSSLSFEGTMLASELVVGEGLSKLFNIKATKIGA